MHCEKIKFCQKFPIALSIVNIPAIAVLKTMPDKTANGRFLAVKTLRTGVTLLMNNFGNLASIMLSIFD